MSKNIIAVNAGPRKGWNTDTLVEEAVNGARAAGAEIEKYDLFRLEKYTLVLFDKGQEVKRSVGDVPKEEILEILHIKPIHLDQIKKLPTIHNDPFDRLIIAQAKIENMTVVSKDHVFDNYEVDVVWDRL